MSSNKFFGEIGWFFLSMKYSDSAHWLQRYYSRLRLPLLENKDFMKRDVDR